MFPPTPNRHPQGGGLDPPHEIFDFAGTPDEGEPWFPLPFGPGGGRGVKRVGIN